MPAPSGLSRPAKDNLIAYKPRSAHLQPFQGLYHYPFPLLPACPTPESLEGSLDVGYTRFPGELRTGAPARRELQRVCVIVHYPPALESASCRPSARMGYGRGQVNWDGSVLTTNPERTSE